MGAWFSRIDPSFVIGLVVGLVTWGYKAIRGEKHDSIEDLARGLASQAVEYALGPESGTLDKIDPSNVATRIEGWIWTQLEIKGIKRSPLVEKLAHPIIAEAIATALAELRKRDTDAIDALAPALSNLAAKAQSVADVFAIAEAKGRAAVADMPVERVTGDEVIDAGAGQTTATKP